LANHKSALKRAKQNLDRRIRNKSVKTRVKKVVKEVRLAAGDAAKETAVEKLTVAKSAIDKNSGEALSELFAQVVGNDEVSILDDLKKDPQHKFVTPSGAEMTAWKNAFQPVIDNWKKETPNGETLIKAFQEELDRYRSGK